jgi:hypothetical protein
MGNGQPIAAHFLGGSPTLIETAYLGHRHGAKQHSTEQDPKNPLHSSLLSPPYYNFRRYGLALQGFAANLGEILT